MRKNEQHCSKSSKKDHFATRFHEIERRKRQFLVRKSNARSWGGKSARHTAMAIHKESRNWKSTYLFKQFESPNHLASMPLKSNQNIPSTVTQKLMIRFLLRDANPIYQQPCNSPNKISRHQPINDHDQRRNMKRAENRN